jgi:hypothetical protein
VIASRNTLTPAPGFTPFLGEVTAERPRARHAVERTMPRHRIRQCCLEQSNPTSRICLNDAIYY